MDKKNKLNCNHIKPNGKACKLPAGYRTFHLGTGKCYHHEYPNDKAIPHKSTKLSKGFCTCKSRWEKNALEKLDANSHVVAYTYEPSPSIPYTDPFSSNPGTLHYAPDILVHYDDSKSELIEVINNFEIYDEKNIAKFEVADEYARKNDYVFIIWSYDYLKMKVFTFQAIKIEIYSRSSTWLALPQVV